VNRNFRKVLFLAVVDFAPIHRNVCFAAPADYLDTADLKLINSGGMIREDVLDQIFDISDVGTPFLDLIPTDSFKNSYSEWPEDKLPVPSLTNAVVSGSDRASTDNDTNTAGMLRVGNHAQISTKEIFVTTRGQHTDTIGQSDVMGYQTAKRLQDLRRDCEAISLSGQASVADDNNATAGKSAGLGAWIKTNLSSGAGGSSPGFQTGTKLVSAQVPGEGRGLTMTLLSAQIENVYNLGGNTTVLMSVPGVTKRLAQYLFTTPYAAKPTQNVEGTGGGVNQTSQGFIDVFKTDFGFTINIVPNRVQQLYADAAGGVAQNVANVYGLDPRFIRFSTLYGWKVEVLGKQGLSDRKLASVDWMLKVLLERAQFNIADINPTTAVVA
jgi:hypothetical protein